MNLRLADRRVAVIGGSGFIGWHIVQRLVQMRAEVLSISRSIPLDYPELRRTHPTVECVQCDLTDATRLTAVLGAYQPSVVYHMAAHPDAAETYTQMRSAVATNILGSINVLEAAQAAGAQVLVMADSTKVYGNSADVPFRETQLPAPLCSYASAKVSAWHLCKLVSALHGIQVVSLRLTFVYGPRQRWNVITYVQQCADRGEPVRLQGGFQTRDPLYVDDAVEAFVAAAIHPEAFGHAINIGGGSEIPVFELCRKTLDVLGSSVAIVANALEARMTEMWRSYCDNEEPRRLLGWSPRVSLVEGLTRTLRGTAAAARTAAG